MSHGTKQRYIPEIAIPISAVDHRACTFVRLPNLINTRIDATGDVETRSGAIQVFLWVGIHISKEAVRVK
jgi:hypothetical protein